MLIRQLSMFIENKTGRLSAALKVLADNNINISALSLADSDEYGVLRLIVDDTDKAKSALTDAGIVVTANNVIAIAMDDKPAGTLAVLELLNQNGMGVEYMYACIGKITGKAIMVVRAEDCAKADEILQAGGYDLIAPADVYRI
ncbi:MAG: ACT domain-containing protein [Oscillospiraceae bacterium]|nr:ACT domain-containing protein [Candidatus Equicaccousia limihippi]